MSTTLLNREKLVRVLGMLGSGHDGEVAAAGRAADRMIREAGLCWPDLIRPAPPPPPPSSRGGARRGNGFQAAETPFETAAATIEFVLQHEEALTHWERDFARSIRQQRYPLSARQGEILRRMFEKAYRAGAGAP